MSDEKRKIFDLLKQVDEDDSLEESLAENIALVEYYYGVIITPDFPLMKRLNMQEHLSKFIKIDVDNMTGAVAQAISKTFR